MSSLAQFCLFSSRGHRLASSKYLSATTESYDIGPVTGLSPSVVKWKNAALCFNRLKAARGKLTGEGGQLEGYIIELDLGASRPLFHPQRGKREGAH